MRARAAELLSERDQTLWLMGNATGRAIAWRLLDESKVLGGSLANSTATVQSAIVAVHDFVKERIYEPVMRHCPELFLQMKAEHDRRTADRAPNTN